MSTFVQRTPAELLSTIDLPSSRAFIQCEIFHCRRRAVAVDHKQSIAQAYRSAGDLTVVNALKSVESILKTLVWTFSSVQADLIAQSHFIVTGNLLT